jgi:Asp-tRNA(Asn)/Glu-tRNA(Gln) amidotransferase A subunit family amidase
MNDYQFLWSIVHYPGGVVPVTLVQENEEIVDVDPRDKWTHWLNETCKGSAGMPISVSIVGHSFEDEKVLGVMKSLSDQIKFKVPFKK